MYVSYELIEVCIINLIWHGYGLFYSTKKSHSKSRAVKFLLPYFAYTINHENLQRFAAIYTRNKQKDTYIYS